MPNVTHTLEFSKSFIYCHPFHRRSPNRILVIKTESRNDVNTKPIFEIICNYYVSWTSETINSLFIHDKNPVARSLNFVNYIYCKARSSNKCIYLIYHSLSIFFKALNFVNIYNKSLSNQVVTHYQNDIDDALKLNWNEANDNNNEIATSNMKKVW